MEKREVSWFLWIACLVLGFLWSYALLTRIDLFFLVPLWFKTILWGSTGLIFSLLSIKFVKIYQNWNIKKIVKILIPVLAVLLTSILFILLPYQRKAFRTTHTLVIETPFSNVEMTGIFSPDHNYINPTNFSIEGVIEVNEEQETGFVLLPDTKLTYQDSFSGGLFLVFSAVPDQLTITWDNFSTTLENVESMPRLAVENESWRLSYDELTSQYELSLPGNTWGNPDMFWSILGGLLPISNFVGLSATLILATLIITILVSKDQKSITSKKTVNSWLGFIIAILIIRFGFEGQIPDITTWLGALIFIPPALYLIYVQVSSLQKESLLVIPLFDKIRPLIVKTHSIILTINKNARYGWIIIVLIALLGTGALYILTQDGMGVSGDSVHYMEGAKNLATGLGYVRRILVGSPEPITGFPPGFPLTILPGILLGASPETSARIVNLISYFLFILLSGGFVLHFTQRSFPAIYISALSTTFIAMESVFAWVMSEPIFIVLMLVLLALTQKYLKTKKPWVIITLGLISSYFLLVRLAGLSLIGAIALIILFTTKEKPLKTFGKTFLYGFISIIPTLAFFYRNSKVGESISESRGLNFAVFQREYWQILFGNIASWFKLETIFLQENTTFFVLGIITLSIIAFYIYRRLSKKDDLKDQSNFHFLDLLCVFIALYFVMIILNVVIFTPGQTVSGLSRYTLPLYPVFMIFAAIVLSRFVWTKKIYPINLSIIILAAVLLHLSIIDYLDFNRNIPTRFRAYTDIITQCEENLDVFDKLPENAEIYSNNCDFVFYASGISCNHLPLGYESYYLGSELFNTIKDGNIVAVMDTYGSTPVNLNVLLENLESIDHQCMITFYQWKTD